MVQSHGWGGHIAVSDLQLRLPVHEKPGAAGTPSTVMPPKPAVTSNPHQAPLCVAYPMSTIAHGRTHASSHGITVRGTAGERPCAHASSATRRRERLVRVYVMIYRSARGGRCRFLQPSGTLSAARSCNRPLEFLARGTAHWTLRLTFHVPSGHYLVRSDAIDGLRHHLRHSAASVVGVNIR